MSKHLSIASNSYTGTIPRGIWGFHSHTPISTVVNRTLSILPNNRNNKTQNYKMKSHAPHPNNKEKHNNITRTPTPKSTHTKLPLLSRSVSKALPFKIALSWHQHTTHLLQRIECRIHLPYRLQVTTQ